MNTRLRFLSIFLLSISVFAVKLGTPGENVHIRGVNTGVNVDPALDPAAILEVFSEDDGVLIPRLTIAQRDAIPAPPEGLMIYNTDCHLFNYYDGGTWLPFPNLVSLGIGSISGNDEVCEGTTGEPYSIAAVDGATSYSWTLPEGATIASGDGTRAITVDFGTESGVICVIASTPCGSQGECLDVSLVAPSVGGTVTGGDTITLGAPTPTLTASGYTGSIVRWERRLDGGSWSPITHTAATYSETPSSVGLYEYRIATLLGTCPEALSTPDTVVVIPPEVSDSVVFDYTGALETWTVPTGVYSVEIECWGAQGSDDGPSIGGRGGYAEGVLSVTPGEVLYIYVGGMGGFNGGGEGGTWGVFGGGASDVRQGGTALTDRVIVAAGGGGAGHGSPGDCTQQNGGNGGGLFGYGGRSGCTSTDQWGADGSSSGPGGNGGLNPDLSSACCNTSAGAGGGAGSNGGGGGGGYSTAGLGGSSGACGTSGVGYGWAAGGCFGLGGDGCGQGSGTSGGGGGGGGWYGGGGGAADWGGGGGGGSSYIGGVSSGSTTAGLRTGNGRIVLRP